MAQGGMASIPAARLLSGLSELGIVIGLTMLLPYMVHFIPSWDDSPIGAKLLPIFYAPLVAALTRKMHVSVVASVVSPWLNHLLTGSPALPMAMMLCIQLVPFCLLAFYFGRRFPGQFWIGPVAYLVSRPLVLALFVLFPGAMPPVDPLTFLAATTLQAAPGILILGIISAFTHRMFPPSAHA